MAGCAAAGLPHGRLASGVRAAEAVGGSGGDCRPLGGVLQSAVTAASWLGGRSGVPAGAPPGVPLAGVSPLRPPPPEVR